MKPTLILINGYARRETRHMRTCSHCKPKVAVNFKTMGQLSRVRS